MQASPQERPPQLLADGGPLVSGLDHCCLITRTRITSANRMTPVVSMLHHLLPPPRRGRSRPEAAGGGSARRPSDHTVRVRHQPGIPVGPPGEVFAERPLGPTGQPIYASHVNHG